jgi:hypothetical protein
MYVSTLLQDPFSSYVSMELAAIVRPISGLCVYIGLILVDS